MKKNQSGLKKSKGNRKQLGRNTALLLLLIGLLSLSLLNLVFYEAFMEKFISTAWHQSHKVTGMASSRATFCINTPPTLDTSSCDDMMYELRNYECQLPRNDSNNDNLSYYDIAFLNETFLFSITTDGLINFSPEAGTQGYHTANISIDDQTNCTNNRRSYLWTVYVNYSNGAPYLNRTLPNSTIRRGVPTYLFNLNNHFEDPDQDTLDFIAVHNTSFWFSILNDGSVFVSSRFCVVGTVVFNATDPGNLSALSNVVYITTTCPQLEESETGGSGGGGGGMGEECEPVWVCYDWSECLPNGTKSRFCEDAAHCSDTKYWYYDNCTYYVPNCTPEWECTEWSACTPAGTQARECKDMRYCNDARTKPEISRKCTYVPTCFDGVKNGDETGVDCGGSCQPCKIVEQPRFFEDEKSKLWIILAASILALFIITTVIYRIFHRAISRFLARIGWAFSGRYFRIVLLKKDDSDDILRKLYNYKKKVTNSAAKDVKTRSMELAALTRLFFEYLLSIPYEFREEELLSNLKHSRANGNMRSILLNYFRTVNEFEFKKKQTLLEELYFMAEELTQLAHALSDANVVKYRDYLNIKKQPAENTKNFREMLLKLTDVEVALQYGEKIEAQNKFIDLLGLYEMLPEADKTASYNHIWRVNREIRYIKGMVAEPK